MKLNMTKPRLARMGYLSYAGCPSNTDSQFTNNFCLGEQGHCERGVPNPNNENNTVTEVRLGARPETATHPIRSQSPGVFGHSSRVSCNVKFGLLYIGKIST